MDINQRQPLTLQFAMYKEAEPLLKLVQAVKLDFKTLPYEYEFYEAKQFNLVIGIAGFDKKHGVEAVGTVPATLLADRMITHFKPRLHLNAGTAGAFLRKGAQIGEVYIGYPFVCFHSRNIELPGFEDMGIGRCETLDFKELMHIKRGVISTGDSLNFTSEDERIMKKTNADLKEMEAAAIGWVCQQYEVPFLPIKSVTDFVDHHESTSSQFILNLQQAVSSLSQVVFEVIKCCEQTL